MFETIFILTAAVLLVAFYAWVVFLENVLWPRENQRLDTERNLRLALEWRELQLAKIQRQRQSEEAGFGAW